MSYNKQLNLIIENSGKSFKEIAIECRKEGVEVTQSYIGILKNNADRIPSEEVSKAIAKVCGANPEMLIIEGGFDKAPKAIKDKMEIIRTCYKELMKKHLNEAEQKIINEKIDDIPYSEMLDGFILATQFSLKNITREELNQYTEKVTKYEILNDNLFPLIPKGCKVELIPIPLNRYKKGDILAYRKEDKTEYKEIITVNENEVILRNNTGYFEEDFKNITQLGIINMFTIEYPQ